MSRPYLDRHIEPLLSELLDELPGVLIIGPRAVGKTTTAARRAQTIVRLDDEREAAAYDADPDTMLAGLDEPVLLDEWQASPGVLSAVKRTIDQDPRPGRFLITGSVRADMDNQMWPGTGRVVRMNMTSLSVAELNNAVADTPLLDRLATIGIEAVDAPSNPPNIRDYVDLAARSGFPEAALELSTRARTRWLDSYVEQVITRDAEQLDGPRDPDRLRRYLEAIAVNTAGIVPATTLSEAAAINRKTADSYEQLLRNLLILHVVPAWTNNRLKRLTRQPKRYVCDPALAISALRLDTHGVLHDGDLLGRVLDTFVAAQINAQIPACVSRPRLYHLRQEHGRYEVDLIVEYGGGRLIAIEIKASGGPSRRDARHLAWLRDEYGDRFIGGIILHTGPHRYALEERIIAAPIAALWT